MIAVVWSIMVSSVLAAPDNVEDVDSGKPVDQQVTTVNPDNSAANQKINADNKAPADVSKAADDKNAGSKTSTNTATAADDKTADKTAAQIEVIKQILSSHEMYIYIAWGVGGAALLLACTAFVVCNKNNKISSIEDHIREKMDPEIKKVLKKNADLEAKLEAAQARIQKLEADNRANQSQNAVSRSVPYRPVPAQTQAVPVHAAQVSPSRPVSAPVANSDGLLPAELAKIKAFVDEYNQIYQNEPGSVIQKNKIRNEFIAKFSLKGFQCVNGDSVVAYKETPEFLTSEAQKDFYALPIKGNLYAVVPTLWRPQSWQDFEMNMLGVRNMFNAKCHGSSIYSYVNVDREALFVLQGEKWILKRAGQATFSE